jgi:ethanolamine utilization protein EutQ (cupin superfamily)
MGGCHEGSNPQIGARHWCHSDDDRILGVEAARRRSSLRSDRGKRNIVTLGTRESMIKAYNTVEMIDVVFQPGAEFPIGEPMEHDMVCMVTEGELQVKAGDMEFAAKPGDVWSCGKASTTEAAKNSGSVPAIMRTVYLKSA